MLYPAPAPARLAVVATAAAIAVALPPTFPGDGGPTAADLAIADAVDPAVSDGLARVLAVPSDTVVVLIAQLVAVAWFAARRDRWSAATMLAVPAVVSALNTALLKPFWHRDLHDYSAYPSGHTVYLVGVAVTFACLARTTAAVAALAATALAAVPVTAGMIALGYHHATDVVGGAAAATALAVPLCGVARGVRARTHPPEPRTPRS
ncbi:phosphatase PAP2 family protein [Nocardia thailandica]|uniref:Phosphatase PAP2 family protein n=1 Tax=Nocardia thailandica TaxID=257275 RepID=A0ABW6PMV5_9NOCA